MAFETWRNKLFDSVIKQVDFDNLLLVQWCYKFKEVKEFYQAQGLIAKTGIAHDSKIADKIYCWAVAEPTFNPRYLQSLQISYAYDRVYQTYLSKMFYRNQLQSHVKVLESATNFLELIRDNQDSVVFSYPAQKIYSTACTLHLILSAGYPVYVQYQQAQNLQKMLGRLNLIIKQNESSVSCALKEQRALELNAIGRISNKVLNFWKSWRVLVSLSF